MKDKKKFLVTFKVYCQSDNVKTVKRWAHDFSFGVMYHEGADDVKFSVQELPDEEENKEEK